MGASFRQPGIYFHTASTAAASDLPRMDVAGFVGFAHNGPLHTPVLVEDMAHYRDIFGDDVALAWDAQRKRMQSSLLGSTVDAFFRNGGQRCWVVRVAGDRKNNNKKNSNPENIAPLAKFEIPGLYQADNLLPVQINARSPGSWASSLRLSTRLRIQTLAPANVPANVIVPVSLEMSPNTDIFSKVDNKYYLRVRSVPAGLQAGDLLELRCAQEGVRAYLFVHTQQADETGIQLIASEVYWFEKIDTVSSPADTLESLPISLDEASGLAMYEDYITTYGEQSLSIQWLRFDLLVWKGKALQSQVNRLAFHKNHPRFWGNLPDDQLLFGELLNRYSPSSQTASEEDARALLEDIIYPRFALAGKSVSGNNAFTRPQPDNYYLPLDMSVSSAATLASGPVNGSELAAENIARDGLAVFSAELFLDADLVNLSLSNLINEANHQRFSVGRSLKGIHSLLAIEEVSMIAVPDMLHRHWDRNSPDFKAILQAPHLNKISVADAHGVRQLSWTASLDARRYIVQQSLSGDFDEVKESRIERPGPLALDNEQQWPQAPDTELKISFEEDCTRHYFFRVRAEAGVQFTPWSNTRALRIPPTQFYNCELPDPALLGLALSASLPVIAQDKAQKLITFSWQAEDSDSLVLNLADVFELQRATDLDFISAQTVYPVDNENTSLLKTEIPLLTDVVTWFRVRAKSIDTNGMSVYGPWSNTLEIHPEKRRAQTLNSVEDYNDSDFKIVQSELVRLCAARADAIAVLSLPSHYQHDQVSAAVDDLRNEYTAAPAVLSYAALYFPWLRTVENERVNTATDQSSRLQLVPPAGAVCGKMAATANVRGAWIAAENAPLQNVAGLNETLTDQAQYNLANKQVNVIAEVPRGFVVLYANTLVRGVGRTNELKPLNVRRLLILLRRLALREGAVYLFEPNSIDFRNRVQHYWDSRLNDLYQRGAFNGSSAGAAYRVVTDESVNDRRSSDLGRFIVELQVSPSQALSFIHVRLVQNGSDQLQFQEL